MDADIASRADRFMDLILEAVAKLDEARAVAWKGPLPRDTTMTFNLVSLDRVDEALYQLRTALANGNGKH